MGLTDLRASPALLTEVWVVCVQLEDCSLELWMTGANVPMCEERAEPAASEGDAVS